MRSDELRRLIEFSWRLEQCKTTTEIDRLIDEIWPGARAARRRFRLLMGALIHLAWIFFLVAS